jgi:D-aminoacyl-tRNA deacylase
MIALITSKQDLAGINIAEELKKENLEKYNAKLYEIEEKPVYAENIDKRIEADLFIFATKHSSKSAIPSLSVHSPGNWGKAMLGGKDSELCFCHASYLKEALIFLENNNSINFDIIQECTHHGPYLEKPCFFIEIGSTEEQWNNKEAAKIIVKTILHLLKNPPKEYKTAFGIGGLHTTPNFKKIILNSNIAIGHVCPKYNLENLNKDNLKQALNKTIPKSELIILDWKGLGKYKEKIKQLTENYDVKRTSDY